MWLIQANWTLSSLANQADGDGSGLSSAAVIDLKANPSKIYRSPSWSPGPTTPTHCVLYFLVPTADSNDIHTLRSPRDGRYVVLSVSLEGQIGIGVAMGTFKPDAFAAKLGNMNSTQASIETVSNWCQFYRKQALAVVGCWDAEFVRAPPARRLLMLYLANDILQNSRKKVN